MTWCQALWFFVFSLVCRQSVFASDFVAPCYGCLAFFVLENVKYVALIWDVGGLLL